MSFYCRVCLIIFVVLSFAGCRTVQITGKDDFHLLDEVKRFEYDFSIHEGIKFRLLGEYQKAYYFLSRCIEIFPFSDAAHYELSYIYFLAEDFENATEHAIIARDTYPGNKWYHLHLAEIYRESDKNEEAIEVYREALKVFDAEENIYFSLAALLIYENQYDEALKVYNLLEEITGIDERVSLSRKRVYMETGQYEKAHEEIAALIAEFPDQPEYLGILAELYTDMEMYSEALDSYKRLFRIDPDNGFAQLSVAEFYISTGKFEDAVFYLVTAFRNPGLAYSEKIQVFAMLMQDRIISGKYRNEISILGQLLIEEYPGRDEARMLMTDFLLREEEYEEAEKVLKHLHENNPDNLIFAEQYIGVLGFQEKYEEIDRIGVEISDRFPESGLIAYFTGLSLYMNEKKESAVEILLRATDSDEIDDYMRSHIYAYLGDIYNSLDDFKNSDKYFEYSIAADSTNFIAMNNYAYYLSLRGENLDSALQYSKRAVNNEPDNSAFLDTYAWVLYNIGRFEEALTYIRKAYEHSGSERYEIVKHYGQILLKLGEIPEALVYFEEARELTDDYEEIDELIRSAKANYK